jgi:hypothetical protein
VSAGGEEACGLLITVRIADQVDSRSGGPAGSGVRRLIVTINNLPTVTTAVATLTREGSVDGPLYPFPDVRQRALNY